MEADIKNSRKTNCMRKKFKAHRENLERINLADPPHLSNKLSKIVCILIVLKGSEAMF